MYVANYLVENIGKDERVSHIIKVNYIKIEIKV